MTKQLGKSFWRQLKERKVIRVGAVYIIVGWILMQIGEVTFEALALPGWALTLAYRYRADGVSACAGARLGF